MLSVNQQGAPAAQEVNRVLGCTTSGVASRLREVVLLFYSALVRSHLDCCIQLWDSHPKNNMDLLQQVLRMAMKTLRGLGTV